MSCKSLNIIVQRLLISCLEMIASISLLRLRKESCVSCRYRKSKIKEFNQIYNIAVTAIQVTVPRTRIIAEISKRHDFRFHPESMSLPLDLKIAKLDVCLGLLCERKRS
jgi:hypothetical protein